MILTRFYQEMYIRDLNFEFEKRESTKSIDSAQVATATLYKDWLDIKTVDVSKGLTNLLSSKAKRENEKIMKAREAFWKYCNQGNSRKRKIDHQTNLIQICQI